MLHVTVTQGHRCLSVLVERFCFALLCIVFCIYIFVGCCGLRRFSSRSRRRRRFRWFPLASPTPHRPVHVALHRFPITQKSLHVTALPSLHTPLAQKPLHLTHFPSPPCRTVPYLTVPYRTVPHRTRAYSTVPRSHVPQSSVRSRLRYKNDRFSTLMCDNRNMFP